MTRQRQPDVPRRMTDRSRNAKEPVIRSPSLARVEAGNLCAGCGACAMIAPGSVEMEMAPPGFLRPRQSGQVSAEQERRISRVCPGLGQRVEAGGRPDDALWGPYLDMRTGHATDPDLRFVASSGGALSALLVHLLEEGQVHGVVQTWAAGDASSCEHQRGFGDGADIRRAAGSRYAPSAPFAHLGSLLGKGMCYAFVGKPCDAAALRALAREDDRVSRTFPVILSFFCAGVPSQSGAEDVLSALGIHQAEAMAFRYRGHGWPGKATATLADGSERSMSYQDSWGGILSRHVQHRCKICADGTGKAADIVCADAWHADEKGYPLFEESDGISLIVARTEVGERLLRGAEAAGRLRTEAFDVNALARLQPGQYNRRRVLLARLWALRLVGRPVPRYEGLQLWNAARHAAPLLFLRNFLGMLRRIILGRAP